MAREHKDILDPNIHEPKGAGSASANDIIVADGVGATSFKQAYASGVYDYNDSGVGGAISLTPVDTFIKMTNDGAGPNTNITYGLPGVTDIFNVSTSQFDFTGLELGDSITLRVDLDITTTAANTVVNVNVDLGVGGGAYSINIGSDYFKSAGTFTNKTFFTDVYMGDNNTRNNPGEISVSSDTGTATALVNGWASTVIKRNPIYV